MVFASLATASAASAAYDTLVVVVTVVVVDCHCTKIFFFITVVFCRSAD